eukprot:TCONS_00034010-protein
MAYKSNFGKNPFEDEDEDKFQDLSDDPELMNIRQQQDLYRQKMVQSSNRSVQMIIESQSTAMETSEALRKQREQLERTSKNLDKINGDLDESDRNITSLKSIWGTMSNWFKKPVKKVDNAADQQGPSSEEEDKQLQAETKELQQNLRKLDNFDVHSSSYTGSSSGGARYRTEEDDIVDKNLDTMLAGLTMLKGQGMALGKEIDEHNDMLEDIQRKTDKSDVRIEDQNKRMNKILRR